MEPPTGASSISVTGKGDHILLWAGITFSSSCETVHAQGGCATVSVSAVWLRIRTLTICSKKCDDGTIFLGDGSLAAAPTSRITNKGIHPVIKVVDDKCLYVAQVGDGSWC